MSWLKILDWLRRVYPEARVVEPETGPLEVVHTGDPSAEYEALTERVALLVSPAWAPIFVEGPDAVSYLHRRLSNSIETLEVGRGTHALQLEGDGRLASDLLVYRGQDALFVLAGVDAVAEAHELIEKFTLMDEVEVGRQWETEATLGLAGPRAHEMLARLLDPPAPSEALAPGGWGGLFSVTLGGLPCRIFEDARWPFAYYHLCIPPMALEQVARLLDEACGREGGRAAGELAARLARIEAGIPRQGQDLDDRTIPLEAEMRDALSEDKGCYPGQEVIARITNLGHPARLLRRLSLEGEHAIPAEAKLTVEGREAGCVTSSATWPGLGRTEALGYLKWADREAQAAEINLAPGDRRVPARVGPLKEIRSHGG